MHHPFTPFSGPGAAPFQGGGLQPGFGFSAQQRRALHEHRRQARREFRDYLRGNDAGRGVRSDPASVLGSVRASDEASAPAD